MTFLHPFSLAGVEGEQAAGTYAVETVEEPIEGLSFVAYRRLSTTIVLPSPQYGAALEAGGHDRPARPRGGQEDGTRSCASEPR